MAQTIITREAIEQTEWAKRFRAECPTSYKMAIALAEKVDYVAI